MVVARGGDGDPEDFLVFIHGRDHGQEENEELLVFRRGLPGIQKVFSSIGTDGPVVVFAGSVDPLKRFFMQEAGIAEAVGDFLHDLHGQLVVVDGDVGGLEDRRQFMLGGGDLVVLGLGRHAQFPELAVKGMHILGYLGLEDAEVMVLHLLPFGRRGAHEGAAGEEKILSLFVEFLVDQEVFLLGTYSRIYMVDIGISQKVQNLDGRIRERLHGAQEGGLFVQSLAAVGAEGCRNVEGSVLDKSG